MKVKYNHWYPCKEGTLPEDFEGFVKKGKSPYLLLVDIHENIYVTCRYKSNQDWLGYFWTNIQYSSEALAWMLFKQFNLVKFQRECSH